jgi:SET domain-containing protein
LPKGIKIKKGKTGNGVFADKDFKKDEFIYRIEGLLYSEDEFPDKYKILVDGEQFEILKYHHIPKYKGLHLFVFWEFFINHSCDETNYYVYETQVGNTCNYSTFACRDIKKGEELTFNGNTTQYVRVNPFICECGSEKCFREIRGAKFLSEEDWKKYDIKIENIIDWQ